MMSVLMPVELYSQRQSLLTLPALCRLSQGILSSTSVLLHHDVQRQRVALLGNMETPLLTILLNLKKCCPSLPQGMGQCDCAVGALTSG